MLNTKVKKCETQKELQDKKALRLNEDFIKAEAYKEFADLSIKRINEQISVNSLNDSAIIKRCSDIIFETLKEKLEEQK